MLMSVLKSKFTDKTAIFEFAREKEEELLALKKMIEDGKIQSIIDKIYPFPGMKNVVSFAQLSCNLTNMRLISGRHSATHTIGVEKHPQFCRKHRKTCSVVWYFARLDIR